MHDSDPTETGGAVHQGDPGADDMEQTPVRVDEHPVLGPREQGAPVAFMFDGTTFAGIDGEPIAAALLAHGVQTLRSSPSGRPRGAYCFIGHCFECRVMIDGTRLARACLEPVREGMKVARSDG